MQFRFEDDYSFSFKIRISDVEIRRYLRIKASHLWSIANQTIFPLCHFPRISGVGYLISDTYLMPFRADDDPVISTSAQPHL